MQVTLGLSQFLCHWILRQHRLFQTTSGHAWLSWYLCDKRPVLQCVCPVHAGKAAWLLWWHLSCPWIGVIYLVIEETRLVRRKAISRGNNSQVLQYTSRFVAVVILTIASALCALRNRVFSVWIFLPLRARPRSKEGIPSLWSESLTENAFY